MDSLPINARIRHKNVIDEPYDVTANPAVNYMRLALTQMARKYGGDCTLNEVRILNEVISFNLLGRSCSVSALHKATGIPTSTVSRIVKNFVSDGWLSERRDPTDGRKRIVSLGLRSLEQTFNDITESTQCFKDFLEHGRHT